MLVFSGPRVGVGRVNNGGKNDIVQGNGCYLNVKWFGVDLRVEMLTSDGDKKNVDKNSPIFAQLIDEYRGRRWINVYSSVPWKEVRNIESEITHLPYKRRANVTRILRIRIHLVRVVRRNTYVCVCAHVVKVAFDKFGR